MDFTLSLAHFCELHGPTSVLCTQALPISCSTCCPNDPPSPQAPNGLQRLSSPLSRSPNRTTNAESQTSISQSANNGCASCRISLPEDITFWAHHDLDQFGTQRNTQPPLRTTEAIHACVNQHSELNDNDMDLSLSSPHSIGPTIRESSCHSHNLEYVSNSSPIEPDTYSGLRRATIRTLSGEQLPRGRTSGPLFFGDAINGYTIAYVFRLADLHARGHQRYYALLALAGSDTRRAFEACTIIWSFFEQLAISIIEKAEHVALQTSPADDSPTRPEYITPVSSFLTGRTMDPDGYTRRGAAHVRANSIAELVDDKEFFCELHMTFVGMLQELGRILGGIRVTAPSGENNFRSKDVKAGHLQRSQDEDGDQGRQRLSKTERVHSVELGRSAGRSQIPSCTPALPVQLRQVIV